MKVKINRLNPDVKLPTYGTKDAACFDLAAAESTVIQPHEIKLIRTGLIIESPAGYFLAIYPRSSTPRKFRIMFPHSVGIIDPDYSGPDDEVLIQVYNYTPEPIKINTGDRIAQGMFLPIQQVVWEETSDLKNKSRGGFGTTGAN
jgi:dUTP pyrophosphatase